MNVTDSLGDEYTRPTWPGASATGGVLVLVLGLTALAFDCRN